jgi:uncharacterized protein YjbJ (UPF0337 family)
MGGKIKIVRRRIQETAGVLADNDKLRAEDEADQAIDNVEVATLNVIDKVKEAARKAVNKANQTACQQERGTA